MSSNNQVLENLFNFRDFEKGLKEDSKVSLFRKFLKESEKVIKVCSLLKMINFPEKSNFLHKNLKHYTYLFKINKNVFKNYLFKVKNKQIKNSFIRKNL